MFFKKGKKEEQEEIIELGKEAVVQTLDNEPIPEFKEEIIIEEKPVILEEIKEEQKKQESIIEETIITEVDTSEDLPEEKEEVEELIDGKIYILGENALAIYLAIKFINSGEKVVIISSKENASTLSNNGITMIENHNLQKSHHKFETTFWLKETPKMLIITSEANRINSSITAISRKRISNTPVVLFTPVRDINYIKSILGNDIYRGFFDGYLTQKSNQVNLFGRAPNIVFCSKNNKKNQAIINCFEKTGVGIKLSSNETESFWEYFSVYTACSLIAAAYNKNIFDVIKDKDKRDKMIPLIVEICKIAKNDGAKQIDQEEILKKIYNTPLSYPYPLQSAVALSKPGDVDLISSNLVNTARKYKIKTAEISGLLKKIYNIILS